MKRYWCRFTALATELQHFEYHGPWWLTGEVCARVPQHCICAAVQAESDEGAKAILAGCFDRGHGWAQVDFVIEKPEGWTPFSERFPQADWMQWA